MAYNSSETEKMMWHACMLREILLVGCSNLDIIIDIVAVAEGRICGVKS
jgi:hypothetical protein